MTRINPQIEESWKKELSSEFNSDYFQKLKDFLIEEKTKYEIFPPKEAIFRAYNLCSFDNTKLVIIGQDPYHNPLQANGLCFSVNEGIKFPPSLMNITKELIQDVGIKQPKNGDLSNWAKQGVLLINATLTVRKKQAGSHQNQGWESFTDASIKIISEKKENVVFLLWGSYARSKKKLIDESKHFILESVHPSPLSAYRGFFGCKHFSKANEYLISKNKSPIDWQFGL
jgi:uracil-DNA glycosylase